MASKAIKESPPGRIPPPDLSDVGPSQTRQDDMTFGRVVGLISGCLALFGALILIINYTGGSTWVPLGIGVLALCFGLVGLLFHAAFDRDVEIRRIYEYLALTLLGIGALASVIPGNDRLGAYFGIGFPTMLLALLFQLGFLQNETDPFHRSLTQMVQVGVGAVMAVLGLLVPFLFAETPRDFLLPYGVLTALLGLAYLVAGVKVKGTGDELSYRIGLGIGGLGVLVVVLSVIRSTYPAWFRAASTNFLLPWGLLLLSLGLVYVVVSVALCSEDRLVVMTRRELGAFFLSPIAYLLLVGMTIIHGLNYVWTVDRIAEFSQAGPMSGPNPGIGEPIVQYFLWSFSTAVCTIFIVPALTMRLLSEESRTGTLEVMLTAPVDEVHVVLSKFFAALLMFVLMWLPLGLYLIALRLWGGKPFDYLPLMSFFIALLFTVADFMALGLFFSSVTRNQIISAVLTFSAMLTLTTIHFFIGGGGPQADSSVQAILHHISYIDLWRSASKGQLIPRYLLFHASEAIFWLFVTVKVLQARKWK